MSEPYASSRLGPDQEAEATRSSHDEPSDASGPRKLSWVARDDAPKEIAPHPLVVFEIGSGHRQSVSEPVGNLGRDGREQRGEPAPGWLSLAFLALGPGAVAA
jgi:hypothetical protein